MTDRQKTLLHIEDNPLDHELIIEFIRTKGLQFDVETVSSQHDLVQKISANKYDLILCDYSLPGYDGLSALQDVRKIQPDIPFIFVSGTIGETRAIEALKYGATDYVLKGELHRLAPSIQRAIREREVLESRRIAEARSIAFANLAHKLSSIDQREEAAEIIVEVAGTLFGWDACTVDLYDREHDLITSVVNFDIIDGKKEKISPTQIGIHPNDRMRKVLKEGAQLILRQKAELPDDAIPFGDVKRPSLSLMFTPIRNRTTPIGILSIQSYIPNKYTQEDLKALQSLGDYCGGALERIRVAEELKKSESILSEAQRIAHIGSWELELKTLDDLNTNILRWSDEVFRIFGYEPGSVDVTNEMFFESVHPEDREKIVMSVSKALKSGQDYNIEHRIILSNGKERIVNEQSTILYDMITKKPIKMVGTVQDITDRKQEEETKKSLESQLQQAQKIEGLGTLAAGIAHDFNNILGIIMGHSFMIKNYLKEPDKLLASIESINNASQRGASLVKQLLTFARKTPTNFQSLNINTIVQEITKLLRETLPKTIVLSTDLYPVIPFIIADATQIHQVLLNLCVNARDAMPKGGTLTITTSIVQREVVRSKYFDASSKEYVILEISDTGIGMDEKTKQKMYEPFFTTKGVDKGTGLGLALVFSIITNHKGYIDVDTALGKGTNFNIYLPIGTDQKVNAPAEIITTVNIQGGNETILVIEDEESLLTMINILLSSKGYSVLSARDGEEGVEMFVKHQHEISVIISDLGLPKLGGEEVYKRIHSIDSQAKIIIASGYIDLKIREELITIGVRQFIQKPYSADEVLKNVRYIIDT